MLWSGEYCPFTLKYLLESIIHFHTIRSKDFLFYFILFYSLFKGTLKIHFNFTTFPNYTRILQFHYNFCCVPSFNYFFLTIERTEKCALMRLEMCLNGLKIGRASCRERV